MGRVNRVDSGGMVYHVLNRANNRQRIFNKDTLLKGVGPIWFGGLDKKMIRMIRQLGLEITVRNPWRPKKSI